MRSAAFLLVMYLAAGCKTSDTAAPPSAAGDTPPKVASEPVAQRVTVDGNGFTPSSITAQRGRPLAIEFTRTTDATCAKEVRFAELGVSQPLPLNRPVRITVPTDTSKTYAFACRMGMFAGHLVVQ